MAQREKTDFINMLMEMRSGQVAQDVNAKFNDVLSAVIDTGSKGELTVTISMEPSRMGPGGTVLEIETKHNVKLKKPEHRIGKSVFFLTKEGRLTRNDPNQTEMFNEDEEVKNRRTQ